MKKLELIQLKAKAREKEKSIKKCKQEINYIIM